MNGFFRLCLMLSLAFAGSALAGGDSAVQYEVSVAAKVAKETLAGLEAAEAFKNAACSGAVKGKTRVVVTCAKPDAQSDALMRGLVKPGVSVKMSAAQAPKAKASTATTCPTGCRWGTSCNPAGACCKITAPAQQC